MANEQQEAPQAYLNYLVYDEDYQLVDQGFVAVSEAAAVGAKNPGAAPEELALEVPIEEDGFVYAYLSNGVANSSVPVHFDDFTVEQQSYIVQTEDFYPYGASFDQSSNRQYTHNYRFNGKELVPDLGLNWYFYGLRNNFDPLLGRFHSIDPLATLFPQWSSYQFAGLNPAKYVDLDGAEPAYYDIQTNTIIAAGDQLSNYAPADAQFIGTDIDPNSYRGFAQTATEFVTNFTPIDEINTFVTGQTTDGREAKLEDYVEAGVEILLIGRKGNTKSYSNPKNRPKYSEGQVDEVWESAKQSDGNVYDPNTGEALSWDKAKSRTGQWDMGHKPGNEYRKLHQDYMDGRITREEFLKEYRNPDNYQPESPSANRSHRYEED